MKSSIPTSIWTLFVLIAIIASVHCQDTVDSDTGGEEEVEQNRCGWWKTFGDGCYVYFRRPLTWKAARELCQRYGGDLVCISSEAENDYIVDLTEGSKAWIGLRDEWPPADMADPPGSEKPEDQWVWTDKTQYRYSNWAEGQPSGVQDCVQINWGGEGKWDDEDYWAKLSFVCEKPQPQN